MEARLPPRWTTTDAFEEPVSPDPLTRLDAVVRERGIEARRWRSTTGGRALLIPSGGPLPVTGPAGLLFVDPATAESLGPLLAAVGEPRVRIAMPEDVGIEGLAAEAEQITLAAGTWRLYRPVPAEGPWYEPGPEAAADAPSPRERWFGSRHGGPA